MDILLVNTTPVVSRLLSLTMRDDKMRFEEVSDVHNVSRDEYDIIFVDEASYTDKMKDRLETLKAYKRIYLTSDKDEAVNSFFNHKVVKPFLPSQIMEILNSDIEEDLEEIPSSGEDGKIIPTQMRGFMKATEENKPEIPSIKERSTSQVEEESVPIDIPDSLATLHQMKDEYVEVDDRKVSKVKKPIKPDILDSENDSVALDNVATKKLVIDDIVHMSQSHMAKRDEDDDEEIRIFDVKKRKKKKRSKKGDVFNKEEIETIKELLKENESLEDDRLSYDEKEEKRKVKLIKEQLRSEGLESMDEEEVLDALESKKVTKKKQKKSKEKQTQEEKREIDYDKVIDLDDIGSLKAKEIKKILEDLEIQIRIRFKDSA
jgi:hypothetical protein